MAPKKKAAATKKAKKAPATKPATRKARPKTSPVVAAVKRDLAQIAKRDKALAGSALAELALMLARELDAPGISTTSRLTGARALLETLTRLREALPDAEENDQVDELNARRTARLAGRATT